MFAYRDWLLRSRDLGMGKSMGKRIMLPESRETGDKGEAGKRGYGVCHNFRVEKNPAIEIHPHP